MQAKKISKRITPWFDGGLSRRIEEIEGYVRFGKDEGANPWFDGGERRQNEEIEGYNRSDTDE